MRRRFKPLAVPLVLLLIPLGASAQAFSTFAEFLRRYEAADEATRPTLAHGYVQWQRARAGFPIVEPDGTVVFLFLAEDGEADVRLSGDFCPRSYFNVYWDEAGEPMSRVGSIFYSRHTFELDARLEYQFIVEGRALADPLNPRTVFSGVGGGEVSELIMPEHQVPTAAIPRSSGPNGSLQVVEEPWVRPAVSIYLPADYDPSGAYPTLYTTDGRAWRELIQLPVILDNMIADRMIEPLIAVMIDPDEDRHTWYYYNPDYLAYLRRVVAYVDAHYATRRHAGDRVHVGSSAGGRASLYAILEEPELFANLGMFSASLAGPPHYYEPYFSGRKRPDPGIRAWLSAGTYEGYIHRDALVMEEYFKSIGASTRGVYVHQGHSFGAWREVAPDMLKYFFGTGE